MTWFVAACQTTADNRDLFAIEEWQDAPAKTTTRRSHTRGYSTIIVANNYTVVVTNNRKQQHFWAYKKIDTQF